MKNILGKRLGFYEIFFFQIYKIYLAVYEVKFTYDIETLYIQRQAKHELQLLRSIYFEKKIVEIIAFHLLCFLGYVTYEMLIMQEKALVFFYFN